MEEGQLQNARFFLEFFKISPVFQPFFIEQVPVFQTFFLQMSPFQELSTLHYHVLCTMYLYRGDYPEYVQLCVATTFLVTFREVKV